MKPNVSYLSQSFHGLLFDRIHNYLVYRGRRRGSNKIMKYHYFDCHDYSRKEIPPSFLWLVHHHKKKSKNFNVSSFTLKSIDVLIQTARKSFFFIGEKANQCIIILDKVHRWKFQSSGQSAVCLKYFFPKKISIRKSVLNVSLFE